MSIGFSATKETVMRLRFSAFNDTVVCTGSNAIKDCVMHIDPVLSRRLLSCCKQLHTSLQWGAAYSNLQLCTASACQHLHQKFSFDDIFAYCLLSDSPAAGLCCAVLRCAALRCAVQQASPAIPHNPDSDFLKPMLMLCLINSCA